MNKLDTFLGILYANIVLGIFSAIAVITGSAYWFDVVNAFLSLNCVYAFFWIILKYIEYKIFNYYERV